MRNEFIEFNEAPEYLHSWYLLLMVIYLTLFLFFSPYVYVNLAITLGMSFLFWKNGMPSKSFLRIIRNALIFSITIFIFATFNPSDELKKGEEYLVLGKKFYEMSITHGLKTASKIFFISYLSMCSATAINYTKVMLYLIVHHGLKLIWGYPILLAMNSILLLKDELERIKINVRFRQLPIWDKIFIFFPLLVFAIRHSERGALSLVTRGLSDKKTFFNKYDLSFRDQIFFYAFFVLYTGMCGILYYFRKSW